MQVASLTPTEVIAVYTKFKGVVASRMARFPDRFSRQRLPLKFTDAVPFCFTGHFPSVYVLEDGIANSEDLFGSHSVLSNEAKAKMKALLGKRRRHPGA
jgi:hypothetical protein